MTTNWQEHYQLKEQAPFTLDGHIVYQSCSMKDIMSFKSGDIIEIHEKEFGLLCFIIKEEQLYAKYFDLDIKEGSFHEIIITNIIKGTGEFSKEEMKEVFVCANKQFELKEATLHERPLQAIKNDQTPTSESTTKQDPITNVSIIQPPVNSIKETKKIDNIKPDRPKRECARKKKMDDVYEQEPKKKKTKTQKKVPSQPKYTPPTPTPSAPTDDVKNILALLQSQQALMVKQQETILQMQQQQQQDKQELTAMIKEAEKNKVPTQLVCPSDPCSSSTPIHDNNKYPSTIIFQIYQDTRNQSRQPSWSFSQPMFDFAPMLANLPWPGQQK